MRYALVLSIACLAGAQEKPAVWTPELSMKVVRIGEVSVSQDGKSAVWTETRNVMEAEKSDQVTQVFLWRGGEPVQLTRGEKSAQDPAFSPDGRYVFFTSDRSGKKNVFRLAADGGEAEMLTDWKGAMGAYRISPDGAWVAFTAAEENKEEEKAKKEKRDLKVVDANPRNQGLWRVAVEPDAAGKREPKKVYAPARHIGEFRWSPDGKRIAFEHRPTPEFNDGRHADLSEVDVETGTATDLAVTAATETQPRYSPDGRWLAFSQGANTPSRISGARVSLLDRASGRIRALPATPDENPQLMDWTGDSSRILLSEISRTRAAIFAIPIDGPVAQVSRPENGTMRPGDAVSRDGAWVGASMETPDEAPEAYLLRLGGTGRTQISRANPGFPKPAATRVLTWKGKDGREVEGLITQPEGCGGGRRCPLLLVIHGGPAGVFSEAFIGSAGVQSIASFATKGWVVLRANIRGSAGYGLEFRAANFKDWGGQDYEDLMAGVDSAIASGIADPQRLAVMGWSYGGYMTAWVVSQTTRFKAAIVGAGLTNLLSMWGTNDIPNVMDDYFGGHPYEQPELYRARSGITFARNVKTPTLFLHGEQDFRVPIGQAYEYYHALKRLGVDTQMVAYPRMPHGPREPKFQLDIMQRHIDWVEQRIK